MEAFTIEAYLLPWWKFILYLFSVVVSILLLVVAVRIVVKFDINKWMDSREVARQRKEGLKHARNCAHAWTLYHASPYSQCNNCLALIATSTLLSFQNWSAPRPLILGESYGFMINASEGSIVVSDFVGKRLDLPLR